MYLTCNTLQYMILLSQKLRKGVQQMKIKGLTIRLDENLLNEFNQLVEKNSVNKSALIRSWIENYINKNKEELKMTNFKNVGTWWNDKEIELVEIDGKVYALNGWNGESYLKSWECTGEDYMDASEKEYCITPQYEEVEGEFEIVGYIVE